MSDVSKMLRTHYGFIDLKPGMSLFMPGDTKIKRMTFMGDSPLNPDMMMVMVTKDIKGGGERSDIEMFDKKSEVARRFWLADKPPVGYTPPPALASYGGAQAIDPNNCTFYLTISRNTSKGTTTPLLSSISVTGRARNHGDGMLGRIKVVVQDSEITEVEIV